MADWTPQSRAEEILFNTINGEPYDGLPQSRIEELLLELKDVIESGGGGGGGTDNYNLLKNLPQINGQTVKGNMSGTTLGLVNMVMGKDLSTNDYTNADKAIVDGVTSALAGKVDKATGKGLSSNDYTNSDKTIVDGVTSALAGKVDTSSVGLANGVAELDSNGRVPSSQLPSYVDDVLEYADLAHFPTTGETGKIYIAEDTNKTYRWSGSGFVEISESLALGETSSTAYAGNKGKANADAIAGIKNGTSINSFSAVETALQSCATKTYVDGLVGDPSSATTTDKSSVVAMVNELNSNYEGVDLTIKFASEISNYSDEWAWIQARLNRHIMRDLHVGDYIPINIAANGGIAAETHKAEIAGINTYRRTGDSGHEVGYHIDWITRDCYSVTVQFNTSNNNNGNASNSSPFLASNLKSWLDGTLYGLLDAKLKAVIKAKRILAPYRYQNGATLTDDNSWGWQDFDKLWVPLEGEIFDSLVWSTKGYGNGQAVQYPIFANSYEHRMKGAGPGGARATWLTASATSGSSTPVVYVSYGGLSDNTNASHALCVPVCFRTMEA